MTTTMATKKLTFTKITNVDTIDTLMNKSKYGLIMRVLVIQALRTTSENTIKEINENSDNKKCEQSIINKKAWLACAEECLEEVNKITNTTNSKTANIAIVNKLMLESKCGRIMQGFICNAIETYANGIIECNEDNLNAAWNNLIDRQTWIECAEEALYTLNTIGLFKDKKGNLVYADGRSVLQDEDGNIIKYPSEDINKFVENKNV